MVVNELLMQFQADILDVPVVRPKVARDDRARRRLCGRTRHRLLDEPDELVRNWSADKRWTPAMADDEREPAFTANGAWPWSGRSIGNEAGPTAAFFL